MAEKKRRGGSRKPFFFSSFLRSFGAPNTSQLAGCVLMATSVRQEDQSLYYDNPEWMKWKSRRAFEAAADQLTDFDDEYWFRDLWHKLSDWESYCWTDMAAFAHRKGKGRCVDLTCRFHHFQNGNGVGEVVDACGKTRKVYLPIDDAVAVAMAFREDRKHRHGACIERMTTGTCSLKDCPKAHTGYETQLNRWREEYGIDVPGRSRKQAVCRHWERSGECWYGTNCHFAHPDNTKKQDPASKPAATTAAPAVKNTRANPFDALRDLDAAE